MSQQLTIEDSRQALSGHVTDKGIAVYAEYGPDLGWEDMQRLLEDRKFVRYPCEVVFDTAPLQPGEFAFPVPLGERPEAGFRIAVHPHFSNQRDKVPWLVLYQLVAVNYGEFASADDAEMFGAAALGLTKDEYYRALCDMADQVSDGRCAM